MKINNVSTIEVILEELLEEGNYEAMNDGIYINIGTSSMFVRKNDLEDLADEKELSKTTRNKIGEALEAVNKEDEYLNSLDL